MQRNFKGCIIFAYNTDTTDYFSQAVAAADRVEHYLNIPTTIFTNESKTCKHNVILTETPETNYKLKKLWLNRSRTQAFELTPYSKTLVIDSDYFLCTDNLNYHLRSSKPFLIASEVYEPLTGKRTVYNLGKTQIPMMWATVMIFDKSDEAQRIFACASYAEKHYDYYSAFYGFKRHPIRNDYIFTIACHLMGGYGSKSYALQNYPLVNCYDMAYLSWNNNKLVYKYDSGKVYGNRLQNIDLHLMKKDQL